MESSGGESTPKRHSRHGSSGRALPRRSTRGPLDINETPISPNPPTTPSNLTHQSSSLLSPSASQYATPRMPSPALGSNLSNITSPSFRTAKTSLSPSRSTLSATQKDFSFLLRPEIYHPLTLLDVPPPFRVASVQPDPSTPLPTLISQAHFRSAAIKASQLLTSPTLSPSDHETIFNLIYTRLSCLTLCNQTTLASQEVKALEDLNSSYYRDDLTGSHLVPWELRVLAIRLQGMGFNDARRSIMGYYDLTREARLTLTTLKKSQAQNPTDNSTTQEIKKWTSRLSELGIRVTNALIEMEDLEGATRFLSSLKTPDDEEQARDMGFKKAVLWLYLGDVEAARACISSSSSSSSDEIDEARQTLLYLSQIASAEFQLAHATLTSLLSSPSTNPQNIAMHRQNLAVTLLYTGQMSQSRTILEELVASGNGFHALTFNLCTVFELATERSRGLKIGVAEQVAAFGSGDDGIGKKSGAEKVNGDFKL